MPEYLSPGVYVEEISTGAKPIEGVSTSTAGFVGAAERGPETPQLISSFLEYQRWYGGYAPDLSYLTYAIQGFFDNGGKRCFVSRVVHLPANAADAAKLARLDVAPLTFLAVGRGKWGNNIFIKINPVVVPGGGTQYQVVLRYYRSPPANVDDPKAPLPDYAEQFDNLTERDGASNNVLKVINASSHLVRVKWTAAPGSLNPTPASVNLADGSDGTAPATLIPGDYFGDLNPVTTEIDDDIYRDGRGLAALENVDDVSLLIVPDEVRDGLGPITPRVIDQCERLKYRFAVASSLQVPGALQNLRPPQDSTYAAFYYPWIRVYDPSVDNTILIPSTGHVAGIYARVDNERGVHKAPANEVIRGAVDLQLPVPKGDQDLLNPRGVNCVRDFRTSGRGIRVWGARTMSSDPEWRYVNVRRLFIYVEKSIDQGTQWVVFEPNYDETWARVVRVLTNFLVRVWRSGALFGTTEAEAFFVKCDRTTMTQDDIDNGRLVCYIGIAPVKPAEFVIFRISQKTADATS